MTQTILKALSGNAVRPYPIWMMRQAGRHLPEYLKIRSNAKDFIDFCFSPDKAAEVTLQPVRRYDMDAAILFADILLVPIALGRDVKFIKGTGPVLNPITVQDIQKMSCDMSVLTPVYETVSKVRSDLAKEKTLIGFCGGPWTVATYMIEGRGSPKKEMAKRFAYENIEAMDDLLHHLADASADYLINQAKAGADVLKIFESWAENLAPDLFDRLVMSPTRQIIDKIRSKGIKTPIIGFPRGAGLNAVRYANNLPLDGCAAGTDVPMEMFRAQIPKNMCTQGNLDPLALRIGGDTLRSSVQSVLDSLSGPHIFNLGHGVAPDVKIENVQAVISHVRTGDGHYV
ncbi:MAG: uroporphyrinogen decarboxylase [Hellea sp.]|nr:uroporphyrinogen decarboxylase [Hellea sp.]